MQWAPDSSDLWAPDSGRPNQWASDSFEPLTLRRAVDLFLGAKAAEGASPKTITWYRMILERAVRSFGADRPVDRLTGPDLRAWLIELRMTLPGFLPDWLVYDSSEPPGYPNGRRLTDLRAVIVPSRLAFLPVSTAPVQRYTLEAPYG